MRNSSNKGSKGKLSEGRDWCMALLNELEQVEGDAGFYARLRGDVEEVFRRKNLQAMRSLQAELAAAARVLPPSVIERIDGVLRRSVGRGILSQGQASDIVARRILEHGRINNADEYRLLLQYLDTFAGDPTRSPEEERVLSLLAEFKAQTES